YVNLLASILGKLDTEDKTYSELYNDIHVHTGGISFSPVALVEDNDDNKFKTKMILKGKAIEKNIPKLIKLMKELINNTRIDNSTRIKELLFQMKSRMEMQIFNKGNVIAAGRVRSYFSPYWNYIEKLKGLDFYWFISDLIKRFDKDKEEIISNLDKIYKTIFNKNNLIISFTGDKDGFKIVKENMKSLTQNLNKEEFMVQKYDFKENKLNEGIISTSDVQYVSKGYNFKKLGYEYEGSMRVLATILNGDYLHNEVRAQGGAYGAGISFEKSGNLSTFSYRDPNLKNTLDVYDNIPNFINKFSLTEVELTQYIIGTIARLEPAMTPYMKGQL